MKEYIEKYRNHMILLCVFVILVHGSKLNSVIIGVDTEALVCQQREFYGGWLSIGRQGLVFLKWLLNCLSFNPFFAGLMTLIFLAAAVIACLSLWDRVSGGQSTWGWLACALLWAVHPVLAEQFYFSLQSMEICLGILLTVLALYLILEAEKRRCIWQYTLSALVLLITFSLYQIFVVMFIFGTVSILILQILDSPDKETGVKGIVRRIAPWFGVFLAAFLCNSLLTAIFFNGSEYLNVQVLWGKMALKDNLYYILTHVVKGLTGYHFVYSSWVYGVLCLVGLVLVITLWNKYGWALLFYYIALMSTPFLMAVICGSVPVVRSQLVMPLMTGFVAYLDVQMLRRLDGSRTMAVRVGWLLGMLCVVGIWLEVQTTERLYYTDACRYAQDEALGRELIERLEPLIGTDDIPVVVLGSMPFHANNSCVQGETIGRSIFDYDTEVEPRYYWSTGRITGFLHTLGYDCEQLPENRIPFACKFAEELPVWPDEDSVIRAGDMVIVKLSEYE